MASSALLNDFEARVLDRFGGIHPQQEFVG
jgi:hypothetical protein